MTTPVSGPCPEWAELLTATHPDDLSPAQRAALDTHLATCPACAAVRADYLRLDGYIQRLPTSRPLPAFPPQLLADGASRQPRQRRAGYSSAERADTPRLIPQSKGYRNMPPGRIRSVVGLVSLALVVALFVVVFRGFTAGHSPGNKTAAPITTTFANGQWSAIPGLTNQPALPVIAPSNPNVVYELSYPQSTPTQITLRRSDDAGATWHNLPLPTQPPADVDNSSLAVSPLNASNVFLTFSLPSASHPEECHPTQPSISGQSTLTPLSGSVHCSSQYYSTDGGQHWSLVQLPMQGAIGAPTFPEFSATSSASIFRAQGQRLYSAFGGANLDGVSIYGTGNIRIVSSTDGGKSWQLVDAQLAASGQNICDYMPAPTGNIVYAITQVNPFCYYDSTSPTYLWLSKDAGAHWTQVSQLPNVAINLTLVEQGDGAPLIYVRMPVSAQHETEDVSTNPPSLEVSADGGKTWHNAPTRGLPEGTARNFGPLGVLGDGSIVKAFETPDQTLTFYAWKNGETAWQPIIQQVTPNVAYVLVRNDDGKNSLWLVSQVPNSPSYSVQRYDFK
jgi:hypothetical protein